MRRAVHVPELDLRRRPVGVHVEREGELEQLLPLVPVDAGVDRRAAAAPRAASAAARSVDARTWPYRPRPSPPSGVHSSRTLVGRRAPCTVRR